MHRVLTGLLLAAVSRCEDYVVIKTNGSEIIGTKMFTLLENHPYAAFQKIPYALPPVKKLRFKEPEGLTALATNSVHNFSSLNASYSNFDTEDTLYLSVFVPLAAQDCAVLVWLHEYSHEHGPDFFIDNGVIVVIVSYRTGILGFLNTDDEFAPGNMGAKDIIMALKWIRFNIPYFGGDINRVTICGSGSAANIIATFLTSLAAEDLFKRAIIQSGSALSPTDFTDDNFEVVKKVYWKIRNSFAKFNRKHFDEYLSRATLDELFTVSDQLYDSAEVRDRQRLIKPFGLTLEHVSKDYVMRTRPIDVYDNGGAQENVDVMMGFTSLESGYKLAGLARRSQLLLSLNSNLQYLLPFEGTPDVFASDRYKEIKRKILDFYFLNGTITEKSFRRYCKYVSDQVIYPILRQARLHAACSRSNLYLYRFVYNGMLNIGWRSSLRNVTRSTGATFQDEICYLLRCKSLDAEYTSSKAVRERGLIKKIARLWTNFVKYGNPTPLNVVDSLLENLHWKPMNTETINFDAVNLGTSFTMMSVPEGKRMAFWDKLRRDYFMPVTTHDEF